MNAAKYISLLNNPVKLNMINSNELEKLAEQHPYSNSIHMLLASKAQQEHSRNFDSLLHKAAIYSGDRRKLYYLIHGDKLSETEEIIETDEITKADQEQEVEQVVVEKEVEIKEEVIVDTEEAKEQINEAETVKEEIETPIIEFTKEEEKPVVEIEKQEVVQIEENVIEESLLEVEQEEEIDLKPKISPELVDIVSEIQKTSTTSKQKTSEYIAEEDELVDTEITKDKFESGSFVGWLKRGKQSSEKRRKRIAVDSELDKLAKSGNYEATLIREASKMERSEQTKGKSTEEHHSIKNVAEKAKESAEMHDELITETLAKVLLVQGKHAQAIEAYQKLSLKFPEKKTYFARQIEKIKNRQ